MSSLPYCKYCNNQVRAGESYLRALGGTYHNNCFKCRKCATLLGTAQFFAIENEPFCSRCHTTHDVPNCSYCARPLERGTDFLRYENQTFHSSCFRCQHCNVELGDRDFFKVDGKRVCQNCTDKVSSSSSSSSSGYSNNNYNNNNNNNNYHTNTNTNYGGGHHDASSKNSSNNYNNNNNQYQNQHNNKVEEPIIESSVLIVPEEDWGVGEVSFEVEEAKNNNDYSHHSHNNHDGGDDDLNAALASLEGESTKQNKSGGKDNVFGEDMDEFFKGLETDAAAIEVEATLEDDDLNEALASLEDFNF